MAGPGPVGGTSYTKDPNPPVPGGYYQQDIGYLDAVLPSTPVYVTNASASAVTNLASSNALVVGTGGGH